MLAHCPQAVAFDVNETIFDLTSLCPRLRRLGLPESSLHWWFAALLRDGFALAASGSDGRFERLARQALIEVLELSGIATTDEAVDMVLAGLSELDPHLDVGPALSKLADADIPAFALTNGSADGTAALLERASIGGLLDEIVSVDAIGKWKPRPDPYRYMATRAGVAPKALALIAAHPWDVHGAGRSGLVTGWVNRSSRTFPRTMAHPHVQAARLDDVVDALLGLPRR